MARRRFAPNERARLQEEFSRLRAQGVPMSRIAQDFGVTSMTLYRWQREMERTPPVAYAPAATDNNLDAVALLNGAIPPLSVFAPRHNGKSGGVQPSESETIAALEKEIAWLNGLVSRLLFENERLKAELTGKL